MLAGAIASQLGSKRLALIPAAVGGGLVYSALSNTCAMGKALSAMPWNKAGQEPTRESAILTLPAARAGVGDVDQHSDAA